MIATSIRDKGYPASRDEVLALIARLSWLEGMLDGADHDVVAIGVERDAYRGVLMRLVGAYEQGNLGPGLIREAQTLLTIWTEPEAERPV